MNGNGCTYVILLRNEFDDLRAIPIVTVSEAWMTTPNTWPCPGAF